MSKSKVHMPKELEKKCHLAIHSATTAAAAAGAIPIPMSDAIPITAAQIAMIVQLGNVFGITLSQAAAKSIAGVALTQQAGRAVVSNLLKSHSGGRNGAWQCYRCINGCCINRSTRVDCSR